MYEYHVGGMLFFCKCLVHQPAAEKMGMVCAQPEGDGDDYLKRVNIRMQPVFKPHVAAHLVIVQHVTLSNSCPLPHKAGYNRRILSLSLPGFGIL